VQSQHFNLTKVPAPKGFDSWGSLDITSITQDSLGYVWLGLSHDGLIKYDGLHAKAYLHEIENLNSLSSNQVNILCQDKAGFIWIGFMGQGLDRFDPRTNKFIHFRHNPKNANSLINDTVTSIIEDHNGVLWIGTHKGLNRFDVRKFEFSFYSNKPDDLSSLSNDLVSTIYEDRKGIIWVGTGSIEEGATIESGGLNRLEVKTGKFKRFLHDSKNPHSLIDNKVTAIFEDSRGVLWIGTAGDGLHTMDRVTEIIERHLYDPAHPEKLSRNPPNDVFGRDYITFINEDLLGNIWIGTYGAGLSCYDPLTKKVHKHDFPKTHLESWITHDYPPATSCRSYTSKGHGLFWISRAGLDPLFVGDQLRIRISKLLLDREVISSCPQGDSILWLGTTRGLIRKDYRDGAMRLYRQDSITNNSLLSTSTINCLQIGLNNELWICTHGNGLAKIDFKTQTTTWFRHNDHVKNSISNDTVLFVYEDKSANLWIVTRVGLDMMNISNGEFKYYKKDLSDSSSFNVTSKYSEANELKINSLFEDSKHNIWIAGGFGTNRGFGGVDMLNIETGKFKHYMKFSFSIGNVLEDQDQVIWMAVNGALLKYDSVLDNFTEFVDPGGIDLPVVNNIVEDNQKNLWVSVSNGIMKINSARNEVSFFDDTLLKIDSKSLQSFGSYRDKSFIGGSGIKFLVGI
jgi:ligand-binding sensor domain-containing protein